MYDNDEMEDLQFEESTDDEVYIVLKCRKLRVKTEYNGSKRFLLKK